MYELRNIVKSREDQHRLIQKFPQPQPGSFITELISGNRTIGWSFAQLVTVKQLRLLMFRITLFIEADVRQQGLGTRLFLKTTDYLKLDPSGAKGVFVILEADWQKQKRELVWGSTGLTFIGLDGRGCHIRVCYF
jgi:hypothetical protein